MGKPFLTLEDLKMCLALFCCSCGIGTLSLPGNYAQVGYAWGTLLTIGLGILNAYATWCISKVLLVAPKHVKTFGDIGEFALGVVGRVFANVSQLIVCAMVPTLFLVLGGNIFTVLFPLTFKVGIWILFMGLMILPVCLFPTLKEGTMVIAAGALATLVADFAAIAILYHNINKQNEGLSPPPANITFDHWTTAVGNLALAFAAGIIIPTLHREHTDPSRMPRVIWVTMAFITILFIVIGVAGDYPLGCQIPHGIMGNILFTIATPYLGFISDRGAVILAMTAMQAHNLIAFGVILFPAFFILERVILRLHPVHPENSQEYKDLETPGLQLEEHVSNTEPVEFPSHEAALAYSAPHAYTKACVLRIVLIAGMVTVACIGQTSLGSLVNFLGASMISLCCVILPIAFYVKVFWTKLNTLQRAWGVLTLVVSLGIAIYASVVTAKVLFGTGPAESDKRFPFCEEKYQDTVYTNRTHYKY
ncbi:Amino Acid/Auxin Permease (AAAP) Family [Thraustotheca clavata]|uniref:Amino Acid/Auxin Permease (AAAP) Family n=1 Tax=Thraustotheca clavata TaxID=74557 RepID=A0A1V9ZF39_9STRA|nr:Amino Acid/Auxin Permease (AAAP) Family [Thraustotheca clavata]